MQSFLRDKIILISGGAGSFGKAFTKEVLKLEPKSVRVFDNSENGLQNLQRDPKVRLFLGDIRDRERLEIAMKDVEIVIHAAALKHVDVCEFNPEEAFKTNIDGSRNVALVALNSGVRKALAISSDKAVHPINVYGATKLGMEKIFTRYNVYGKTRFSCIRSGNFEGSSGSLLEIIRRQLDSGQKITVTDREMSRFWIAPERIAQFAIESLDRMRGGEIFIPKMPEKTVMEMVEAVAPEADIEIIGKRAGEKLHELLFAEDEKPIDKGDYYVIQTNPDYR